MIYAVEWLLYTATEQEMVDRVLMNMHPHILAQSAFLERPRSYRELRKLVGHGEEKLAVLGQRQRVENSQRITLPGNTGSRAASSFTKQLSRAPFVKSSPKCWRCNQTEHVQRNCTVNMQASGTGQRPGGAASAGHEW
jgi:hypothetical protein